MVTFPNHSRWKTKQIVSSTPTIVTEVSWALVIKTDNKNWESCLSPLLKDASAFQYFDAVDNTDNKILHVVVITKQKIVKDVTFMKKKSHFLLLKTTWFV